MHGAWESMTKVLQRGAVGREGDFNLLPLALVAGSLGCECSRRAHCSSRIDCSGRARRQLSSTLHSREVVREQLALSLGRQWDPRADQKIQVASIDCPNGQSTKEENCAGDNCKECTAT